MRQRFIYFCFILTNLTSCTVLRPEKEDLVTIQTRLGDIQLVLFDETPGHKENFLKLARSGFYDSTTFHRVIKGFMIQGGDPNTRDNDPGNDGLGGPDYTLPAEIRPEFPHIKGAVAAARKGDNVNPEKASSGSQFYIVENDGGTPFLDGNYTVFGQVIRGLEVIEAIAEVPRDGRDRPREDVRMSVRVERLKRKTITEKYGYTFPGEEQ